MTKGRELAEKHSPKVGKFYPFDELAADIDAAIRDQALADCRAVCDSCAADAPRCKDNADFHYEGDEVLWCDANHIRAAWLAATGKPLEEK